MKKLLFVIIIFFSNFLYLHAAVELKPLSDIKFKKGDASHYAYFALRCSVLINIVEANYIEMTEILRGKETAEQIKQIGRDYLLMVIQIKMKTNNLNQGDAINSLKSEIEAISLGYTEAINKNFKNFEQLKNFFVFDDYNLCLYPENLNTY
tara:strand:+ start:200 stop:652 length:453 start_codon:yes stop_codon:yes gene_type:complete